MSNEANGDDPESLSRPLLNQRSTINSTSQVAIVGANICPIESLDYEIAENDFFKQDWRIKEIQIFQYIFMKWLLCFCIGGTVALIGFTNNLAVENLAGIKFVITSNMMIAGRGQGLLEWRRCTGNFFNKNIGCRDRREYCCGFIVPSCRKGRPMVHTGACIASLLGQGGSRKYNLTWRWLRYFKNDRDRRDLVTCGSAAGIAAAFRAPVGGLLFALEEMASWWRSALLWRAFFTTAIVAIILQALIDVCKSGKCGLFGTGGLIMFDVTSTNITYHISDVPPVFILGIVGGLLGSLYNFLLERLLRVYNFINEKGTFYKIFLACCISIFTSCLLFGLPWLASCRPCPDDSSEICPTIGQSGNYKRFQCAPDEYNDLASLIFNTNDDAIKNLFSKGTDAEFHFSTIVVFFVTCFFLSIASYGIVAPVGLFIPVIVTGATYGRFVGMVVGPHSNLNHGLFAVLGAASFLGGSMRMTVSLGIILLELTNNLLLLPLMMLVLLISKTVADAFNGNCWNNFGTTNFIK